MSDLTVQVTLSPTPFRSGWRPRPADPRDYRLGDFMLELAPARLLLPKMYRPRVWALDKLLDQGDTSECVAFTAGHWKRALPTRTPVEAAYCHDLYRRLKARDGEPEAEGTDLRTLAKALKEEGCLRAYAFAASVSEIRNWVLTKGPVMSGFPWLSGMQNPDDEGYAHARGRTLGGHAFLISGWIPKSRLTWLLDDVICPNSWGRLWNQFLAEVSGRLQYFPGYFRLKAFDLARLWRLGGDALAAVELPRAQ